MSTLLPPIGARELAPRRPLCKRPRRKVRARVLQNEFCTEFFFRHFSSKLKGRTADEKLLMFYMLLTEQLGKARMLDIPAEEFCENAGRFLHIPTEKTLRTYCSLIKKVVCAEREGTQ